MSSSNIKQILHNTLVGHLVKITNHSDGGLINLEGMIVAESKFMLEINLSNRIVKVTKASGNFLIDGYIFDGKLLIGDYKYRQKKRVKTW
ncbi:MAG: ribonuclease P protein subunit [Candidatus Heimdallarchaeota archaeon]|nr:ribonuclease P protein subunit [Candidatus Heimdallarchaeota archaeon]